eukprot:TRINITY_DN3909_c0_g1_i6.p1 TRINITY_DN3909_c0_g1~~TRINITY_DN3909_c0_g1_i6.p1  ORF type:complete len:428 (+),score=48.76 TRINITY_DN3909_c0_g1_i6:193-1476(+)
MATEESLWQSLPFSTTWTCKVCTLINSLDTTSCEACGEATDDLRAIERASVPITRNQALSSHERSELNRLVDLIRSEGSRLIQDRRAGGLLCNKRFSNSLQPAELVSYLTQSSAVPGIKSRKDAVSWVQRLIDADMMHIASLRKPKEGFHEYPVVQDDSSAGNLLRFGRRFSHIPKVRRSDCPTVQKSPGECLRSALREAVLCAARDSPHPTLAELRAPDFGAVDRTMRATAGEHQLLSSYAPGAFLALRDLWGVPEDVFCASMLDNSLETSSSGGGSSGAFMFFSSDRQFVVKSLTHSEAGLMRGLLPSYVHYCSTQLDTLLPKFIMLLKARLPAGDSYVMVTSNVFAAPPCVNLEKQFDLKGSTANRFISSTEQAQSLRDKGKLPTLKDLNWKVCAFVCEPRWASRCAGCLVPTAQGSEGPAAAA